MEQNESDSSFMIRQKAILYHNSRDFEESEKYFELVRSSYLFTSQSISLYFSTCINISCKQKILIILTLSIYIPMCCMYEESTRDSVTLLIEWNLSIDLGSKLVFV